MLLCRARPDLRLAHDDAVPEVRGVEAVVLPVALVVRGSS
jgi:hypothetical protein